MYTLAKIVQLWYDIIDITDEKEDNRQNRSLLWTDSLDGVLFLFIFDFLFFTVYISSFT